MLVSLFRRHKTGRNEYPSGDLGKNSTTKARLDLERALPTVSFGQRRRWMKLPRLQLIAAAAAFAHSITSTFDAAATSVVPLDLDQITASAKHIVHVRCTSNEVQRYPTVGVVTVTNFVVLDRAKGGEGASFTVR